MAKKQTTMIEVEATGPIEHGDADGVQSYEAGDRFSVTQKQAASMVASGSVIEPGTAGKDDDAAAKQAAKDQAAIDKANQKAADEAAAAAAAEVAKT